MVSTYSSEKYELVSWAYSQIFPIYGKSIHPFIWVNYNISLTWIKSIWGWFPLLTMIPVRSQWGRYNLPRFMFQSPLTGLFSTKLSRSAISNTRNSKGVFAPGNLWAQRRFRKVTWRRSWRNGTCGTPKFQWFINGLSYLSYTSPWKLLFWDIPNSIHTSSTTGWDTRASGLKLGIFV